MRILQVSPKVPWPPKDGGAMATLNLAVGLANEGHFIKSLCITTPKHNYEVSDIPKKITAKIKFESIFVNTDISPLALITNFIFSTQPYIALRFYSDDFAKKLAENLQANPYDIVQLEGVYMMQYIPVIRKHSNAKIALRAHNSEFEIWKRKAANENNILKKVYLNNLAKRIKRFEKESVNVYDLLLPITQRDANTFAEFGNKQPVKVTPYGIDLSALAEITTDRAMSSSLFYIGSLDWMPNQEGLTWFTENVWPKLKSLFPQVKFRVAGRNAPPWLAKMLLNNGIVFLGEVEDTVELYEQNNIMIAPVFSGSGMRVKIIEGMAIGKTIITTTIGAEGIEFEKGKDLFIADDKIEFIATLKNLLENPQKVIRTGDYAKQLVKQNFDIFAICSDLSNFYEKNCTNIR